MTLAQFNNVIAGTNYVVVNYNASNNTALVNINNESSEKALINLTNIISTALPNQSTGLKTQNLGNIQILSGPNFAYKPDRRSVRYIDPTCQIRQDLEDYAQANTWDSISNLSTSVNATEAHAQGYFGDDIVVVLLDSGVDANDQFDCPETPQKEMHGTHIKNIIQAIAPNTTIVSKKVFNSTGTATLENLINTFDVLQALSEIEEDYLLQGKKVILNMSFSSPVKNPTDHDMLFWKGLDSLNELYGNQLLLVTSAGNHGLNEDDKNLVYYPSGYIRNTTALLGSYSVQLAAMDNMISVGSAGLQSGQVKATGFNPIHTSIDYLAYGMNLCANNLNAVSCTGQSLIGSSYSTPVVTGLAALNWNRCSQNTSEEIKVVLSAQSVAINLSPVPVAVYNELIHCDGNPIVELETPWAKQFGSNNGDFGRSIHVDSNNNIYVIGNTVGSIAGYSNNGEHDIIFGKFDSNGNQIWSKQIGSNTFDFGYSITSDVNGYVYIAGYTWGTIAGATSNGHHDIILAKYDDLGNQIWIKQVGTFTEDVAFSMVLDVDGNIYIAGNTVWSILLAKYDNNGNEVWTRNFGSSGEDYARSIAIDSQGNIVITGVAGSNLSGNTSNGSNDVFVAKYDSNGNEIWVRQFGTSDDDRGYSVTIDNLNNVYVTGTTLGSFAGYSNQGNFDVIVSKFNSNGNQIWTRQLGSAYHDFGYSIITDSNDNIFVVGDTEGTLPGNTTSGLTDIFLIQYDMNGNQIWLSQFGSNNDDYGTSISLDSNNDIYITGHTPEDFLGSTHFGFSYNILIAKFSQQ